MLQLASLLLFPGQGLPFLGGGLSQDRSAKYLPPAQEAVQEDHDFQGDHGRRQLCREDKNEEDWKNETNLNKNKIAIINIAFQSKLMLRS